MRYLIGFSLIVLVSFTVKAQQLMLPEESKIYADSIAIYWKRFVPDTSTEVLITITSSYEGNHFEVTTSDTVVVAPYYLLYDDEPVLVVRARDAKTLRAKYLQPRARLRPVKRNDFIEADIYHVLENPTEQNLAALGAIFERNECYVNALFIYYKLYRLGFPEYWNDFTQTRLKTPPLVPDVHR